MESTRLVANKLDFSTWEILLSRSEKRGMLTKEYPFFRPINTYFDRKIRGVATAQDLEDIRGYLRGLSEDGRQLAGAYMRKCWKGSFLEFVPDESVEGGGYYKERVR